MDTTNSIISQTDEILNPFIHRLEFSMYERIKVAIMSVTAAPIRIAALMVTIGFAWMVAVGGLIGHWDKDVCKKPLTKFQRDVLKPFMAQLLRLLFVIGGWHWVTVKGKQASPREAPILVLAPHSSFFDAIVMSFLGAPSIVAKAELRTSPFIGALTSYCEPIYVARDDPNSRQSTIQEIGERSTQPELWSHTQIGLFPEGTCTNRTCLISFKTGAFLPGVPIQPVCLRYKNRNDVVTWTFDGPSVYKTFWTSLCQFHNFMEIEFLPVYVPNEMEKSDPVLYANNVRKIMAKCLDIPVIDCTYADHSIVLKTLRNSLPIEPHLLNVVELRNCLRLGNPRTELSNYLEFTKTTEDMVNTQKFSDYLQVPCSEPLHKLFSTYKEEENGDVIDFRDYMLDLCWLSGNAPELETPIQLAFQVLDKSSRNELQESQLEKILSKVFNLSSKECSKIYESIDDKKGFITYDDYLAYTEKKSFLSKLSFGFAHLLTKNDAEPSANESPSKVKSE